jgi:predicted transcriptional regulator
MTGDYMLCFICEVDSDAPKVNLDDGTGVTGYGAIEALKNLQANGLAASHPTERNLYCLTDLGQAWALDIIERRLV